MKIKVVPDLRDIPPFSGLSASACRYLQTRLRRYEFTPGATIIEYGKRGCFFAIVDRGRVELAGIDGKRRTLKPQGTFGEGMLRYGVPSSFSATAKVETALWVIKRADWVFASQLPMEEGEAPLASAPRGEVQRFRSWALVALAALILAVLILYPEWLNLANQRLTRLALEAGRPDLAESYLRFASSWQQDIAPLYDALGVSLYLQGEGEEAMTVFERAVSQDQELASARNNLGVALLNQSEALLAIEHLQASVDLDPENPDAYLNLGNAFLAAGDRRSAGEAYQQAIELRPDQIDAKALWAAIALEEGQLMEAQEAWMEVLEVDPGHSLALRGIGAVALLRGRPQQAVVDLNAALSSNPNDGTTRVYLGLALESLGRSAEAAAEFERALTLSDDPVLVILANSHLGAIRSIEGAAAQSGKER